MSDQTFSIQSFVLDVDFFFREKAHELQNRLSKLFHASLEPTTRQVLGKNIPEDVLIEIPSLTLELGNVNFENLENEFAAKYETALSDYFFKTFSSIQLYNTSTERILIVPLDKSYLTHFESFLLTGVFTGWAPVDTIIELEQKIEELLGSNADSIKSSIESVGQFEYVRRRLAYQFSESFIKKIIDLLEPAEAEFITKYKTEVSKVNQHAPIVKSDSDSFNKEVWQFILTFLLVEKGSLFSRKEFIKNTLKHIAAHFNVEYHELLNLFKNAILIFPIEFQQTEFARLIKSISNEDTNLLPLEVFEDGKDNLSVGTVSKEKIYLPISSVKNTEADDIVLQNSEAEPLGNIHEEEIRNQKLNWLKYYFQFGSLPMTANFEDRLTFRDLLFELVKVSPVEVNNILVGFSKEIIFKRLFKLGGQQLVKVITTQKSIFISTEDSLPAYQIDFLEQKTESSKQAVNDLLYHFLRTGFLPWWTGAKEIISLNQLFETLYSSSLVEAIELLKLAGNESITRNRFTNQFSINIFLKVISHLPTGKTAVEAFELLMSAFSASDNYLINIKTTLQNLLWQNYILNNYQTFNEHLFFVLGVKEIANIYHLDIEAVLPALTNLLAKRSITVLKKVLNTSKSIKSKEEFNQYNSYVPEELIIEAILSQIEYNDSYRSDERLRTGLRQVLQYFFEQGHFPNHLEEKSGFSRKQFFKAAMLLFYKVAKDDVLDLLNNYYDTPKVQDLLKHSFSLNIYQEKPIKLLYIKLHSRNKLLDQTEPLEVEKQDQDLFALPLLQKHYFIPQANSAQEIKQKAKSVFEYFLTWNTLPEGIIDLKDTSAEEILKEMILFLFTSDRTALQLFLQKNSNSHEAVISISGMFKPERGSIEAIIDKFLKPHLHDAVVDYLFDSDYREKEALPAKESITYFDLQQLFFADQNVNIDNAVAVEKAASLLDYFLTYNKLPDDASFPNYNLNQIIKAVTTFLFKKNKELLNSILQKESHHHVARINLHEWMNTDTSPAYKEFLSLTNVVLQKDILLYLQNSHGNLSNEKIKSLQFLWKNEASEDKKKVVLQAILKYQTVREEWVRSVPLSEFFEVARQGNNQISKQYKYIIGNIIKLVKPVLDTGYEQEDFALQIKVFLLLIIAGNIKVKDPEDLVAQFFKYLDVRKPSFVPAIFKKIQPVLENDARPSAIELVVISSLQKNVVARLLAYGNATSAFIQEEKKSTIAQNKQFATSSIQKSATKEITTEVAKQELVIEKSTKLYIVNAGLVLFHPFISTFFTLTSLVEKGKFIDKAAQHRAIHLLQYLVYGTTEHEEQNLVLNKILCGLPLEEPVPAAIILSEKEIAIAAELFSIIFQRWDKMKNSSIEGFRVSFLQRQGRLEKGEKEWTLRVEQKGYDLLLQTLPWTYGMIKLNWMPQPLQVDWI